MTISDTVDTAADEALYLARYEAQQKASEFGGGLASYDPLDAVKSSALPSVLPVAENRTIAAEALSKAVKYAGAMNSSALIIWRKGSIETERYYNDVTAGSLINSKSLAKPLTAILIGRAIQQGHIKSLDQPVSDIIREWRDDPQKSKIKIRYLLDMRSGLLPQGLAKGPEDVLNRAYLHPRHDEIIIKDYPITHDPGSRYEYSNANSELIAPIIERATGMRYGDYVGKALLDPLGAAGGTIWINRSGGTAHSGCCIQLPAQTYLRLGLLLLNDGLWEGKRLLPENYVAEMRKATPQNPHAGLGVWVTGPYAEKRGSLNPELPFGQTLHSQPYAADDLFLFDGNGNQVVYIVPSQNLIILRTGGRAPKGSTWDNSYLPNLIIDAINREPGELAPTPQKAN